MGLSGGGCGVGVGGGGGIYFTSHSKLIVIKRRSYHNKKYNRNIMKSLIFHYLYENLMNSTAHFLIVFRHECGRYDLYIQLRQFLFAFHL